MAATAGDRIRIIAGTAGRDLGQAICAELDRPLSESFTTKYYNGCTYVQVRGECPRSRRFRGAVVHRTRQRPFDGTADAD